MRYKMYPIGWAVVAIFVVLLAIALSQEAIVDDLTDLQIATEIKQCLEIGGFPDPVRNGSHVVDVRCWASK